MKIRNSKYLMKLLTFSLLLGILPVLILGIFSYSKSSEIIQKKVNESNLQVLLQSEMRIEETLKSINNYYNILANSQTVSNYMSKQLTYKDYDSIMEIQRGLSGIQSVQSSVKNAYYINFDNDWVVSDNSFGDVDDFINKDKLQNYLGESKNSFWIYNRQNSSIFKSTDKYIPLDNVCLIIKLPFNLNNPSGAIVVNLLGYEFSKVVVQNDRIDEALILDEKYNTIVRDGKSIFTNNNNLISGLKNQDKPSGYYRSKIDGKDIEISYRKSSYNNWTYVSIYLIKDMTMDSRTIGWVTFFICIFMIICIFIISILGSKIIYNPIHKIYDDVIKSLDLGKDEKYADEVKYIDEGINSLVKTQSQMVKQIKNQLVQLEEFFLIKLINGELNKNEVEGNIKTLGYETIWKWLSIVSIQIDTFEGTEYVENNRDLLMLSINSIVCELISDESRFQPALTNKVQIVLIGGNQESYDKFKEFVFSKATKIKNSVKEKLDLSVSVGISRPFSDLNDAQIAYKESIEALMCSIRFGKQVIFHFEDVQPDSQIRQPYPINIQDELIEAINHGDVEKSNSLINQFVDKIIEEKLSFSEYQVCLNRLLISIIGVLQDSGESFNILLKGNTSLFNELNSLKVPGETKRWFNYTLINPVIDLLEKKRSSQYKNILEQVINMIHEEFDKDLSLESCAARLNYHPSYIWRILKKEMNITFTEYLSQYRLTMAKKWLEETNMSILEISERLRYNNSQNFIRYFKKLEGITPGQYRDNFRLNSKVKLS